ncbi:MAG: hypothetical protein K9N07_01510 [Candidatus Cloacimonetes bacterium]|nr:hypothetical protein [Candidatus Cloacimonadota bacterium]
MKTIGIVKETKNKWERRVPLNPKAVKKLIEKQFRVILQPSDNRIYTDEDYISVGAELNMDLSNCDFIIGVKEIKEKDLIPGKPYLFFSHVIKGQAYNMPMLQYILDKQITLLDYEKIADRKNRRLVFFGDYAGKAGMIDTIYGFGKRLKEKHGLDTPFLQMKQAYQYRSVNDAVEHLDKIGKEIRKNGLPEEINPVVVFLMGYGHVSHGARIILNALPLEEIKPEDLSAKYSKLKNNKIYISTFKEKHMVRAKNGNEFNLLHYYKNPLKYESRMEEFLDFCSIYVNAIYWSPESPVFVTNEYLKKNKKMIIIGDISCDINGSVAATIKATTSDHPVYVYNAESRSDQEGYQGDGVAVMSVDNLPCEFSKESSDNFSKALSPFIESLLTNDYKKPIKNSTLPDEIKKACIAHQGKLEEDYTYLTEYLLNNKK